MMKLILLEDQADQAERLQMMLERYRREHEGLSCSFQHYDNSIRLLTEYSCDADVLFLDIQKADIPGIKAAAPEI